MAAETTTTTTTEKEEAGRLLRGATHQRAYRLLLAINCAAFFVGSVGATLLTRFYFLHGGSSRWLATLVQSAGFPLLLLPIRLLPPAIPPSRFSGLTPKLLSLCLGVGILVGINNFFFSWGISYLPVSTSSLLLSSQLAFVLALSVLLVRQSVTFNNLNCVVLLTLSSVLLALGSPDDRPDGVSRREFFLGFLATVAAALLFALYLPLVELIYQKVRCYAMVMEMQVVTQAAAAAVAAAGMAAGGGFKEVRKEVFDLGKTAYWTTVVATVAGWQLCFMGTAGMVFLTSSLNSGICMTALMVANVVGGVAAFGDKFGGQKAVATAMCVWGFASYLFGERTKKEEEEEAEGKEMAKEKEKEKEKERAEHEILDGEGV